MSQFSQLQNLVLGLLKAEGPRKELVAARLELEKIDETHSDFVRACDLVARIEICLGRPGVAEVWLSKKRGKTGGKISKADRQLLGKIAVAKRDAATFPLPVPLENDLLEILRTRSREYGRHETEFSILENWLDESIRTPELQDEVRSYCRKHGLESDTELLSHLDRRATRKMR